MQRRWRNLNSRKKNCDRLTAMRSKEASTCVTGHLMTVGVETQRSLSCEPRLSLKKYHADFPQRSGLERNRTVVRQDTDFDEAHTANLVPQQQRVTGMPPFACARKGADLYELLKVACSCGAGCGCN